MIAMNRSFASITEGERNARHVRDPRFASTNANVRLVSTVEVPISFVNTNAGKQNAKSVKEIKFACTIANAAIVLIVRVLKFANTNAGKHDAKSVRGLAYASIINAVSDVWTVGDPNSASSVLSLTTPSIDAPPTIFIISFIFSGEDIAQNAKGS